MSLFVRRGKSGSLMMAVSDVSVRMGTGGVCRLLVIPAFAKTVSKKQLMTAVTNVSVRLGNGSAVIGLARRTVWMVRPELQNAKRARVLVVSGCANQRVWISNAILVLFSGMRRHVNAANVRKTDGCVHRKSVMSLIAVQKMK